MAQSSISGRVVPLHVAIAEAAQLIRNSRLTVIAGLGADVEAHRSADLLESGAGRSHFIGAGNGRRDRKVDRAGCSLRSRRDGHGPTKSTGYGSIKV